MRVSERVVAVAVGRGGGSAVFLFFFRFSIFAIFIHLFSWLAPECRET